MKKILLVEDDIALSAGLCFELEEEDLSDGCSTLFEEGGTVVGEIKI